LNHWQISCATANVRAFRNRGEVLANLVTSPREVGLAKGDSGEAPYHYKGKKEETCESSTYNTSLLELSFLRPLEDPRHSDASG
jgi:hypothetical protein